MGLERQEDGQRTSQHVGDAFHDRDGDGAMQVRHVGVEDDVQHDDVDEHRQGRQDRRADWKHFSVSYKCSN